MRDINEEKILYSPVNKNSDSIPIWFYFPAPYMMGMSSLGYLKLFSILDQNPEADPERIYTNTIKTRHNPKNVELIGVSCSFEFDFLGLFNLFEKHNMPFNSKDRGEEYPLVFGGGPVLTCNPEPFATFFDFVIIGDGEAITNEIISVYKEYKDCKKSEKLKALSKVEGIYVPSLYEVEYNQDDTIKSINPISEDVPTEVRRKCTNLQECVYTPIHTQKNLFKGAFIIEIARGCPKKCHFCIASYLNLPSRYPTKQSIFDAIDLGIANSNKISFLGALITEHPNFEEICEYVSKKRDNQEFEMSVSSLRADNINPLFVETLVKCGQRSSTIAVEAGSERLRNHINKQLTNEQIYKSVKTLKEYGLSSVKIYGMLGIPSETDEDIKELADLMKKLKKEIKINITLSVSSFVPKAHTPFQVKGRELNKTIQKRNDYLRKELHMAGVKYKPTSIKWDYIQGILSRGDRRLSPLLEQVYKYKCTIGSWARAYKDFQGKDIPELDWYVHRTIEKDEICPWAIINNK